MQDPNASSGAPPTTVSKIGVYALVNGRSEFREVSVIHEGSDYYVVRSVGTGRKVLRGGDTVIIEGVGLQDGMLIKS